MSTKRKSRKSFRRILSSAKTELESGTYEDVVFEDSTSSDEVAVRAGDGADTLAVRRGNTWYFQDALDSTETGQTVAYGNSTDEIYAGRWQ